MGRTAVASSADLIARRLAAAGCRYAFGIPGGEVLAIMDALERAAIRVVLAKHENCAGFMGEGVHHRDRAPAILVATIGPGIANAANVIANCFQHRVPMVALTGCVSPGERHSYTHQVFDHVRLVEPIAKAAFRVEDGMAAILADKAVAIATGGRPGPVLLDVPVDVQTREQSAPPPVPGAAAAPMAPAAGRALDTARAWLAEARRPLMIAGLDVLTQQAEGEVAAFCRRFRVPLITTYKAKGVLPEDDPLALGAAGLSPRVDGRLLPHVAGERQASLSPILRGRASTAQQDAETEGLGEASRRPQPGRGAERGVGDGLHVGPAVRRPAHPHPGDRRCLQPSVAGDRRAAKLSRIGCGRDAGTGHQGARHAEDDPGRQWARVHQQGARPLGLDERGDPGLLPAGSKCGAWQTDYNEFRPLSSIGQKKAPIELAFDPGPACRPRGKSAGIFSEPVVQQRGDVQSSSFPNLNMDQFDGGGSRVSAHDRSHLSDPTIPKWRSSAEACDSTLFFGEKSGLPFDWQFDVAGRHPR